MASVLSLTSLNCPAATQVAEQDTESNDDAGEAFCTPLANVAGCAVAALFALFSRAVPEEGE